MVSVSFYNPINELVATEAMLQVKIRDLDSTISLEPALKDYEKVPPIAHTYISHCIMSKQLL